ncbi:glycosyltransferase family 4 protein [Aureitalea marina]|uniref:Glycosyl transferase family 1 n=1 Tax=Aureitalea marina TaxID=930804 RepID=A0A2S7KMN7_9FLAO|nr:glycosyltransferase family 4 protein [Aureitalea marina]PQB03896.1 glycosyl transferase family 1 [Aureitalea marina]
MKRKLLYIGNQLADKGRTPTTIDRLAPRLKDMGFEVLTASSKENKFLRLLDMLWTTWRFASASNLVLIDTYSTTNFWYAVWVARICRFRKCPYIPYLHGGNLPERLSTNPKTSRNLFGKAKIIVSPSSYLIQQFKEAGFDRLHLIPNFINLSDYPRKDRSQLRPRLLWVRSFAAIYNPQMALDVVEKLMVKYPTVELCMVGPDKDGSLYSCQRYAREKELPVRFTGKLGKEQWIELSQAYDIFINTTHFDNMPVSVIEAMTLGLIVVSTNVGGIPYLIEHGKEGYLVPDGDAQAMASQVSQLLESPDGASSIQEQASEIIKRFDWSQVQEEWKSLLRE